MMFLYCCWMTLRQCNTAELCQSSPAFTAHTNAKMQLFHMLGCSVLPLPTQLTALYTRVRLKQMHVDTLTRCTEKSMTGLNNGKTQCALLTTSGYLNKRLCYGNEASGLRQSWVGRGEYSAGGAPVAWHMQWSRQGSATLPH